MGFVFKTEQFRRTQSSVSRRALVAADAPEMPDSDSKEWGVDDIQSVLRRTDPDSVQVLFSALSRGVVTPEKTVDDTETTVLTWASRELGRCHTDVSKKKLSLLVKYAKSSTDGFALNADVSRVISRISGHPDDLEEGLTTMLKLLINDKDSATMSAISEGGYFSRSQLDLYRQVAFMILKSMELPTEVVSSIDKSQNAMAILNSMETDISSVEPLLTQVLSGITPKEFLEIGGFGCAGHSVDICIRRPGSRGPFELTVCNRGFGMIEGQSFVTYSIDDAASLARLAVQLRNEKSSKDMATIHQLIAGIATPLNGVGAPRVSPQKTGNCGWASLSAGILYGLYKHDEANSTRLVHDVFKKMKPRIYAFLKDKLGNVPALTDSVRQYEIHKPIRAGFQIKVRQLGPRLHSLTPPNIKTQVAELVFPILRELAKINVGKEMPETPSNISRSARLIYSVIHPVFSAGRDAQGIPSDFAVDRAWVDIIQALAGVSGIDYKLDSPVMIEKKLQKFGCQINEIEARIGIVYDWERRVDEIDAPMAAILGRTDRSSDQMLALILPLVDGLITQSQLGAPVDQGVISECRDYLLQKLEPMKASGDREIITLAAKLHNLLILDFENVGPIQSEFFAIKQGVAQETAARVDLAEWAETLPKLESDISRLVKENPPQLDLKLLEVFQPYVTRLIEKASGNESGGNAFVERAVAFQLVLGRVLKASKGAPVASLLWAVHNLAGCESSAVGGKKAAMQLEWDHLIAQVGELDTYRQQMNHFRGALGTAFRERKLAVIQSLITEEIAALSPGRDAELTDKKKFLLGTAMSAACTELSPLVKNTSPVDVKCFNAIVDAINLLAKRGVS